MVERSLRRVALLAIHPEHATAILEGRKTVEFRKRAMDHSIEQVLLYATSPAQKIVGAFRIARIDQGSPTAIWIKHGGCGAIPRRLFRDYFSGSSTAVAIVVGSAIAFTTPLSLGALPSGPPAPQSFVYLSGDATSRVLPARQHLPKPGTRSRRKRGRGPR